MKFDLFDALEQMRSKFGEDVDIRVVNVPGIGFEVRLSVIYNHTVQTSMFTTSRKEMTDSYVDVMNERFKDTLIRLEKYLEKEKQREAG